MADDVNKYGFHPTVWKAMSGAERNPHYQRLYQQKNRPQLRKNEQKWRDENREKRNERQREYRRDNKEHTNQQARESYWRTREKQLAYFKKRRAKDKSKRKIGTSPDAVYALINNAVSWNLPKFVRDDIVSAMCLAVLEGNLFVEDISKEAAIFLRAYNREYDHFKTVSLDAPIFDGVTILDTLTDDSWGHTE